MSVEPMKKCPECDADSPFMYYPGEVDSGKKVYKCPKCGYFTLPPE